MSHEPHPSFLELDRHCLGAGAAGTGAHLEQCARCKAYVASYSPAASVPAWLDSARRTPSPVSRRARWTAGLALAAAIALAVIAGRAPASPYVGVKGGPAVAVYVQHRERVSLWHGDPLSAGDRIRLEVTADGFDHVAVFSAADEDGALRRLYAGRVTQRGPLRLPTAWQLDDQGDAELLVVILSRAAVSAEAARALLGAHDPSEVWLTTLRLPKQRSGK